MNTLPLCKQMHHVNSLLSPYAYDVTTLQAPVVLHWSICLLMYEMSDKPSQKDHRLMQKRTKQHGIANEICDLWVCSFYSLIYARVKHA